MKGKYSKENMEEVVSSSVSISQCLTKLGLAKVGGNYSTLHKYIRLYGLDTSHFTGSGWNVGLKFKPNKPKPLSEILVNPSGFQSFKLKLRLLTEGLKEYKCEECNNTEWFGKPIPLELHHIDGDKFNNCIENLVVICPNCHALTDHYRGRNIGLPKSKDLE